MSEQAGMHPDNIFYECSICGKKIYQGEECIAEDDFIYCQDCYREIDKGD